MKVSHKQNYLRDKTLGSAPSCKTLTQRACHPFRDLIHAELWSIGRHPPRPSARAVRPRVTARGCPQRRLHLDAWRLPRTFRCAPLLLILSLATIGGDRFRRGLRTFKCVPRCSVLVNTAANHSWQKQLRSGCLNAANLRPVCACAAESGDAFTGSRDGVLQAVALRGTVGWRGVFPAPWVATRESQ